MFRIRAVDYGVVMPILAADVSDVGIVALNADLSAAGQVEMREPRHVAREWRVIFSVHASLFGELDYAPGSPRQSNLGCLHPGRARVNHLLPFGVFTPTRGDHPPDFLLGGAAQTAARAHETCGVQRIADASFQILWMTRAV